MAFGQGWYLWKGGTWKQPLKSKGTIKPKKKTNFSLTRNGFIKGAYGLKCVLGHERWVDLCNPPPLRLAFVDLEAGSTAREPPKRRMFKNVCVQEETSLTSTIVTSY